MEDMEIYRGMFANTKFMVDTYTNLLTIIELLLEKGILTNEELLTMKEKMKQRPEIASMQKVLDEQEELLSGLEKDPDDDPEALDDALEEYLNNIVEEE
jgi:uncharacterized protein YceH (UPF0502 family)